MLSINSTMSTRLSITVNYDAMHNSGISIKSDPESVSLSSSVRCSVSFSPFFDSSFSVVVYFDKIFQPFRRSILGSYRSIRNVMSKRSSTRLWYISCFVVAQRSFHPTSRTIKHDVIFPGGCRRQCTL